MVMNETWTKNAMEQFGFTQEQADHWLSAWKTDLHDNETALSYIDWLKHKIAAARDDLIIVADQALDVLRSCDRTADNDPVVRSLSDIISLVAPGLATERERLRKGAGE